MRARAALVLILLLAFASPAGAATVSYSEAPSQVDKGSGTPIGTMTVRAAPGEANRLRFGLVEEGLVLEDEQAPLESSTDRCERLGRGSLRCGLGSATFVNLRVEAGDGDDEVITSLSDTKYRVEVRGGAGADVLTIQLGDGPGGAPGDDQLDGGPGRDTVATATGRSR